MWEATLAAAGLLALSAGAWAWTALAPDALLSSGFWLVAGGLAFGLPAGLVYHELLRRSLARVGRLPPRWWLSPLALHPLVPLEDAFPVALWCRLGALGCGVAFLGCGVFALGALRVVF